MSGTGTVGAGMKKVSSQSAAAAAVQEKFAAMKALEAMKQKALAAAAAAGRETGAGFEFAFAA
jgi:hypothetical protein